jgi:hypothetical protein
MLLQEATEIGLTHEPDAARNCRRTHHRSRVITGPAADDQLIGSWKVLNLKATTGDKVTYPLGEQLAGPVSITPPWFWLLFVAAMR